MTQQDTLRQRRRVLAWLALAGLGAVAPPAARACREIVVWRADLTPARTPAPKTSAATVAIDFDFAHPGATVFLDTKALKDVQAIDLHVAHSFSDHTGPTVLSLYDDVKDGPLTPSLTRHVTPADLHPQTSPRVRTFADLVQAVLDGRAYVSVTRKPATPGSAPPAVLSGFIEMHKVVTYDDSTDEIHVGALHRAHKPLPVR